MNPVNMFSIIHIATRPVRAVLQFSTLAFLVAALAACGGGASTESNPATSNATTVTSSSYNGPNALTDDIRAFQLNVWERLRDSNRCGSCHVENAQSPMFVRQDDVNLAYAAANSLINLDSPASSRLVTKVAGGHNCWLASDAACATAITSYIEDWAAGTADASRQIQLVAPAQYAPGDSRVFPADAGDTNFESTVWPLLTANCAECHSNIQTPFFAVDDGDSGNDADVISSYDAARSKINLNDPATSRLVVRLRSEFHNCWTQCDDDATTMENAIIALAGSVPTNTVALPTVFSDALTLPEGIVASGGNRHEADVIALYEFKTGSGSIALDSSGVLPEAHLTLTGDVGWVGGWGIQIVSGKAQASTASSKKLHDLITATGEYSIEAWVAPANVVQEGPARIVSYSAGTDARNFTLGQTQYNYDFLHRSSSTDGNGEAALSTNDDDEDLQATLQHVVVTFDPVNGRRIYVNGVFTDDTDPVTPGNLNDWDDSFALVLGNEASSDRQWEGAVRMVAIHNRALTQEQITQNFEVGVGEKFFLLFGIGDLIGLPQSYIMFEVAQYDSYSYLFNKPTFINLDPNVTPGSIQVRRMNIGINGAEASVGQAYRTLGVNQDLFIEDGQYSPETGQLLSDLGTIIPLQNGPQADEFYLTFELLGANSNVVTENSPLTPPPVAGPGEVSDIGLRTFDEINASMAAITGVDAQLLKSEFDVLRQQLPAVETLEGFLSAHQMGIAQLAIGYCDALIEDAGLRGGMFGSFDFGADVVTAYGTGDSTEKNQFVSDLYDSMIGLPGSGSDLTTAPTRAEVKAVLIGPAGVEPNNLYDSLAANCLIPADCDASRTQAIAKSLCGSALGSAAMLLQ